MDELNFYLLLELSYDPPEENPDKIEEAIKQKQAKWSKLRNHPTQGTLAQKYIGLLPKIREVMADDSLRKKEALKAKQLSVVQAKASFSKIDKNLELLIKKGHITSEEVDKLAQLHSVKKGVVLDRIKKRIVALKIGGELEKLIHAGNATPKQFKKISKKFSVDAKRIEDLYLQKEKEKEGEIKAYLNRCRARGFITKEEIRLLSDIFVINSNNLRKEINYPVKSDQDVATRQTSSLDPSIEKLITDNLKIIDKKNLYNFLDISPDVGPNILRARVQQKEAEIRKITVKDATATASGVLLGHCISLFKSEEARKGYDRSLVLAELNENIEVAGIKDDLRPEYLYFLLRMAIKKGMDLLDAADYIEQFGKDKGWKVKSTTQKASKQKSGLVKIVAGVLILLMASGALWFGYKSYLSNQAEKEFQTMLTRVESEPELNEKIRILNSYIGFTEDAAYIQRAKDNISQIQEMILKAEYESVLEKASPLYKTNDFKGIRTLYDDFLSKHPTGKYSVKMQDKIAELSDFAATEAYKKLETLPENDYERRLQAYREYLAQFPQGPHTEKVRKLVADAESHAIEILKDALHNYEQNGQWDQCIELCNTFIKEYPNSERKEEVLSYKKKYQNRTQSEADLAVMKQKANAYGEDYEAARLIYLDYMEANPELPSYFKRLIVKEIKVLDERIAWQMKAEKEWEETFEYSSSQLADLGRRIQKIERFINTYPKSKHLDEAGDILEQLKSEKAIIDAQSREERERREWQKLAAYTAKSNRASTVSKIQEVEQYIRTHSSGKYVKKAGALLGSLKKQQQLELERQRQQQQILKRKQAVRSQIQAFIARTGGRFADNGNSTFTDRQTGLTWYMYNSALDLNQCIPYQTAVQYVQNLNAGGHKDWRLPTVNELESLLKIQPAFPAGGASWFWSFETFWHGWNKMSHAFSSEGGRWKKHAVAVDKCGAALAVRQ